MSLQDRIVFWAHKDRKLKVNNYLNYKNKYLHYNKNLVISK